jgi:hypothetical protein
MREGMGEVCVEIEKTYGPPVLEGSDGSGAVLLDIFVICSSDLIVRLVENSLPSTKGARGSLTSIARTFQSVSSP